MLYCNCKTLWATQTFYIKFLRYLLYSKLTCTWISRKSNWSSRYRRCVESCLAIAISERGFRGVVCHLLIYLDACLYSVDYFTMKDPTFRFNELNFYEDISWNLKIRCKTFSAFFAVLSAVSFFQLIHAFLMETSKRLLLSPKQANNLFEHALIRASWIIIYTTECSAVEVRNAFTYFICYQRNRS